MRGRKEKKKKKKTAERKGVVTIYTKLRGKNLPGPNG